MESSSDTSSNVTTQSSSNAAAENSLFAGLDCRTCGKVFSRKDALLRHSITHSGEKNFLCSTCGKVFGSKFNLFRHQRLHDKKIDESSPPKMDTPVQSFVCPTCGKSFSRKNYLTLHLHVHTAKRKSIKVYTPAKRSKKEVLSNLFFEDFLIPSENANQDLLLCFDELHLPLTTLIEEKLREKQALKWRIIACTELFKIDSTGEEHVIKHCFASKFQTELIPETIPDHLNQSISRITQLFEDFMQNGSGWILRKVLRVDIKMAQYQPLAASSYIPLPKKIIDKKAVLNIQNEDNKCLIWCLLAHKMDIHWKEQPHRVSHYLPYEAEIKLEHVELPVPVCKIPIIERLNNLRINVFGLENVIFPLYVSSRKDDDVINLLLISTEDKHHYCLIRNFSRLLGDLTKHHPRSFYCYRCLHRFSQENLLIEHRMFCDEKSPQRIKLPNLSKNILKFDNVHYQHPIPYIIYADFESLIVPISSSSPNPKDSFTEKMAHHEACGYAYVIIGPDGQPLKPISIYRGPHAASHFLNAILKEKDEIMINFFNVEPLRMSAQDEISFENATHCSICYGELGMDRVRDHCHLTGQFRGAAHSFCNLQFRLRKFIPVVFHNLKNYDAHLIMQVVGDYKDYQCDVIGINMEKYITFSLSRVEQCKYRIYLQFIDSFQFLPTSLQKLVSNLDIQQFKILKKHFPENTDLLLRKGVYPYEYMDCFEKFNESVLPPLDAFYSSLSKENISMEEYQHAQNVWNTFRIQNLGGYHDLYVASDVLQLADVFQNFRKLCLQYYELDPAHLLTSPSLAWQACLKMTGQSLELFTDIDMYLFIERGIRGGISTITKRYAQANNSYIPNFDSSSPSKYILYLDANNLYGWAMSQYLPYGELEWMPADAITTEWILQISPESEIGFIFEVDLEYPQHLHDLHNDYPLAPEILKITEGMISPISKQILEELHEQKFKPCEKLVPNLNDKTHYVVHYRTLKLYLQLGLKLKKVHKVLRFKQKPWLKTYIDFNTQKRSEATSSFEKDFFKLLNNSVFGKTMENMRNRKDIKLIHDTKKAKKLIASPSFSDFKLFSEEFMAIERLKTTIFFNRPIYVGFSILELSKFLMYDFHYNFIKKQYAERACLLFTDTDSLMYEIETSDVYEDMKTNLEFYDTSDYPKEHALYSTANKKVIGKFKDETNSKPIIEFVGLRSKMYSFKTVEKEKKTAKGVARQTIKLDLSHADYLKSLQCTEALKENMISIQSDYHKIFTIKQNKVALSPYDDKRFIKSDGITTMAYGHYKLL